MVENRRFKYAVTLQAVVVALTVACCLLPDALFLLAAVTAQVGLYAAAASQKPFALSLVSPLLSFGAAFVLTGEPSAAALSLMYAPAGIAAALCIRRCCKRSKTMFFTSLTFGAEMLAGVLCFFSREGVGSISDASGLVGAFLNSCAEASVKNMPDIPGVQGVGREAYRKLLYEYLRLFSFGSVALLCNAVAYFSTALSKRIMLKIRDGRLFANNSQWLYVLSKPSAVLFIVCYFCALIGGSTLSLPQRIAFNTPVVALIGGVLVMAARVVKEKLRISGLSGLIIFAVVLFFFGVRSLLVLLSVIGLITALRYKPTEDRENREICKK